MVFKELKVNNLPFRTALSFDTISLAINYHILKFEHFSCILNTEILSKGGEIGLNMTKTIRPSSPLQFIGCFKFLFPLPSPIFDSFQENAHTCQEDQQTNILFSHKCLSKIKLYFWINICGKTIYCKTFYENMSDISTQNNRKQDCVLYYIN